MEAGRSVVSMLETPKKLTFQFKSKGRKEPISQLKTIIQEEFPLTLGKVSLSILFILQLTKWGLSTLGRIICCPQSTGTNTLMDTPTVMSGHPTVQSSWHKKFTITGIHSHGHQTIGYGCYKCSDSGEEESLLIQNVLCASTLRDVCSSLSRAAREAQWRADMCEISSLQSTLFSPLPAHKPGYRALATHSIFSFRVLLIFRWPLSAYCEPQVKGKTRLVVTH